MLIFSFRARAGRLSFVDFFFPYIDVASHVFVVSVMCIFKNPIPARDPSVQTGFSGTRKAPSVTDIVVRGQVSGPDQ